MRLTGPKAIHYSVDAHRWWVATGFKGAPSQTLPLAITTEQLLNTKQPLLNMFPITCILKARSLPLDLP